MSDDSGHDGDVPAQPAPATWRQQPNVDVWWSRRGQVSNWMTYALALAVSVGAVVLLPAPFSMVVLLCAVVVATWQWAKTYVTAYRITQSRIEVHSGVLSPQMNPVEFYRVNDYRVRRPFIYRPFGRGNLWVFSEDTNRPRLCFVAIRDPEAVEHLLRNMVEPGRRSAGTRVIE